MVIRNEISVSILNLCLGAVEEECLRLSATARQLSDFGRQVKRRHVRVTALSVDVTRLILNMPSPSFLLVPEAYLFPHGCKNFNHDFILACMDAKLNDLGLDTVVQLDNYLVWRAGVSRGSSCQSIS